MRLQVPDRRNSFRITQTATDHCSRVRTITVTVWVLRLSITFVFAGACVVRDAHALAQVRRCGAHWSRRPPTALFYTRESSALASLAASIPDRADLTSIRILKSFNDIVDVIVISGHCVGTVWSLLRNFSFIMFHLSYNKMQVHYSVSIRA